MSIVCDYGPDHPAAWHLQAVGDAPDLLSSRFACGGEHLAQARAVVGTGGREFTVTALAVGELDGPREVSGTVDSTEPVTAAEKFEAFHELNPHVYQVLVRLARQWVSRTGRRKVGIAALFERARWELSLETTEDPNLNNSYRAYYARLLMRNEPDLEGLFELRRSQADEWLAAA